MTVDITYDPILGVQVEYADDEANEYIEEIDDGRDEEEVE